MGKKQNVVALGFALWVLGVLTGANAGDLFPGNSVIPSGVMLVVALLASVGNFVVLYKKVN